MKGKAPPRIILILLLTSILTSVLNIQPAKAADTIYIRADGSIDPPTAPISTFDSITYTFNDNICDSIVVERSNILVDGAGYTLQGVGSGNGFYLAYTNNVTIKNTNIKDFSYGIWTQSSHYNRIISNYITANAYSGIMLSSASDNSIFGNYIRGHEGDPNERGLAIELHSSSNNSIIGNNITHSIIGIRLYPTSNYNSISGNKITDNVFGFYLESSSNTCISGNNITSIEGGLWLIYSPNCTITENTITENVYGALCLFSSSGCNIAGNYIANGMNGLTLDESSYCKVYGNNIDALVWLYSSYNRIYHNNFMRGHDAFYPEGSTNIWDDGYPSGGNYWSDYTGVDEKSGPNQDQPASDGIGDTPRVIDAQNMDHYPLIKPWIGIVTATVDIKPDTLNLKNKSKWVTAHMELSAAHRPADIDVSSIKLNDILQAELSPTEIEDYDNDGILDLMVKFNGANLMPQLHVGINRIIVSGKVNGRPFEGVDTIKVNA